MQARSRSIRSSKKTAAIEKRWYAYALAGAGAVVAAPQAHAAIVFTSVNQSLDGAVGVFATANFFLDNVDTPNQGGLKLAAGISAGAGLFTFRGTTSLSTNATNPAAMLLAGGNAVLFNAGSSIGPAGAGQSYKTHGFGMSSPLTVETLNASTNQTDFFGLRFNLNGAGPNFGWLEVQLDLTGFGTPGATETATVLGFAYQTTPNTAIVAGAQSQAGTPEPATAGMMLLAAGAAGVAAWRKRKQTKRTA